jgi:hypothetical protein
LSELGRPHNRAHNRATYSHPCPALAGVHAKFCRAKWRLKIGIFKMTNLPRLLLKEVFLFLVVKGVCR